MKILSFTLYMFVVGAVIIKQLYYWTPQKPVQRTTRSGKCREWFCSFQFINVYEIRCKKGRKRRGKQLTKLNGDKKIQKNPERMNIEEIMDSTLFKKLIQS